MVHAPVISTVATTMAQRRMANSPRPRLMFLGGSVGVGRRSRSGFRLLPGAGRVRLRVHRQVLQRSLLRADDLGAGPGEHLVVVDDEPAVVVALDDVLHTLRAVHVAGVV